MADITMCKGGDCPLRNKCYRFKATPTEKRQSYFFNTPFKIENNHIKCEFYWGENSEQIYNQLKNIIC